MNKLTLETLLLSVVMIIIAICLVLLVTNSAGLGGFWVACGSSTAITFMIFLAVAILPRVLLIREIQQIMGRGGPKSLSEYLVIFPGACKKCGSREFEIEIYDYPDSYSETRYCKRCNPISNGEKHLGGSWAPTYRHRRVYSPYLSREQSAAIPDFPWEASAY